MRSDMPVPVWAGTSIVGWAWVDAADYPTVRDRKWWLTDGYACCSLIVDGRKTTTSMHRMLMGLSPGDMLEVDHGDRDRLNNRRGNMTVTTRYGNEQNHAPYVKASRHKGVTRARDKWKAQASLDGRYVYLGTFATEAEAAEARARWAREQNLPA